MQICTIKRSTYIRRWLLELRLGLVFSRLMLHTNFMQNSRQARRGTHAAAAICNGSTKEMY